MRSNLEFRRTTRKLEDAREAFADLETAVDFTSARHRFAAFVNASFAVINALRKDGGKSSEFKEWLSARLHEAEADPVAQFFKKARNKDFHEAQIDLNSELYVGSFSSDDAGPPPAKGASIVVGSTGIYWLVDKGKPSERRIPVRKGGHWSTRIRFANPPTVLRGKELVKLDPLSAARMELAFLDELLEAARREFATSDT
ncbi:MAG TPA: hypothetical protein VI789_01125 [Dehalococcoidia bacterium]|nr:hypothetical protein [Dehalococcoidia bacterium]